MFIQLLLVHNEEENVFLEKQNKKFLIPKSLQGVQKNKKTKKTKQEIIKRNFNGREACQPFKEKKNIFK